MKHITKFNEDSDNSHLLVVNFQSRDEIVLTVIEMKHFSKLESLLNEKENKRIHRTAKPGELSTLTDEILELIYNNTVERVLCQSYAPENYFKGKYNFKTIYHVPELGE